MTNKIGKEIERLVVKYPWPDSKELFRTELEYLVLIAEREQMIRDHKIVINSLKKKVEK